MRNMPERYGPWSTAYGRFHLWVKSRVFQVPLEAVIAQAAACGQADLDLGSVDSTVARTRHRAVGMAVDARSIRSGQRPRRQGGLSRHCAGGGSRRWRER